MKKKKLPCQIFRIDAGTYEFSINVIITEDRKRAMDYLNHKFELPRGDLLKYTEERFTARGLCFYSDKYCPVIWLPAPPKTPREYGTFYHELFHGVCQIMNWAHIPLTDSSEEAYCHLIGHLTTQFLKKIK